MSFNVKKIQHNIDVPSYILRMSYNNITTQYGDVKTHYNTSWDMHKPVIIDLMPGQPYVYFDLKALDNNTIMGQCEIELLSLVNKSKKGSHFYELDMTEHKFHNRNNIIGNLLLDIKINPKNGNNNISHDDLKKQVSEKIIF